MSFRGLDGLEASLRFIDEAQAQLSGIPLIPDVASAIELRARKRRDRLYSQIRGAGVPQKLEYLLEARRKKEAVKLAKALTMRSDEFAHLIFNADQIGFRHEIRDRHHVPPDLRGRVKTPEDALEVFRKRRVVTSHLFTRAAEWHCFHFDYSEVVDESDLGPQKAPHWVGGPHIHYLSHLWGMDLTTLRSALDERSFGSHGSVHIRFQRL